MVEAGIGQERFGADLFVQRRPMMRTPASPVPSNAKLAGSGTDAVTMIVPERVPISAGLICVVEPLIAGRSMKLFVIPLPKLTVTGAPPTLFSV